MITVLDFNFKMIIKLDSKKDFIQILVKEAFAIKLVTTGRGKSFGTKVKYVDHNKSGVDIKI